MASTHRHGRAARRRHGRPARRWGYPALAAGIAAVTGGVLAVLPHQPPAALTTASACGVVTCTAAIPSGVSASRSPSPAPSPHRTRRPHRPHRKARHRARPRPHRSKAPSPRPTSPGTPATRPPAPPPTITVTYSVVSQRDGSFQGQFTITNHGRSGLDGWQLTATLTGDRFTSAWGSGYQVSGDTITYSQALLQGGIGPGSSLTLSFDAQGSSTSPASCSIDGSACVA